MKNFWLLSFTLLVQLCYSQKNYYFDYILEFDKEISLNSKVEIDSIKTYLINSNKNSYFMSLNKGDFLNVGLNFIDNDGILIYSTINKSLFNATRKITIDCKNAKHYYNPYKYQVENYIFINLKDTIINNKSFYHYCIKSNRSLKYQKRNKIMAIHYIVDKNSTDFLPFLIEPTCYEEWKKERNIPNGLPFIIYQKNFEGKITHKIQLKTCTKIEMSLVVPEECDFTKNRVITK
jgi:hypothetical protein